MLIFSLDLHKLFLIGTKFYNERDMTEEKMKENCKKEKYESKIIEWNYFGGQKMQ